MSQEKMLTRTGQRGAELTAEKLGPIFERQLREVVDYLTKQTCFDFLEIDYHEVVREPLPQAATIRKFVGDGLDLHAMVEAVDSSLYRNR